MRYFDYSSSECRPQHPNQKAGVSTICQNIAKGTSDPRIQYVNQSNRFYVIQPQNLNQTSLMAKYKEVICWLFVFLLQKMIKLVVLAPWPLSLGH